MGVPIQGYPDYLIEETGAIFSLKSNKYLKASLMSNGYTTVELFNNLGSKRLLVHRLVAQAFIPNPNGYPCINHKDEIRNHNHVSNLEWCDYKYNQNYGTCKIRRVMHIDYTTQERKEIARENGKSASKPVCQLSRSGKILAVYPSGAEATRQLNIRHINEVCLGRRQSAGGYLWRFSEGSDALSEKQ